MASRCRVRIRVAHLAVEKTSRISATNKKAFDLKKQIEDSVVLSRHGIVSSPDFITQIGVRPQEVGVQPTSKCRTICLQAWSRAARDRAIGGPQRQTKGKFTR